MLGKFGQGGKRSLFTQFSQGEFFRGGADASAAGEDGLATGG